MIKYLITFKDGSTHRLSWPARWGDVLTAIGSNPDVKEVRRES